MKKLLLFFVLAISAVAYGSESPSQADGERALSKKVCRFMGVPGDCLVGTSGFDLAIQKMLNDCLTIQSFVDVCIKKSDEAQYSVRFMYLSHSLVVMWVNHDGDYTVVAKIVVEQTPKEKHPSCVRSSLFTLPRQSLLDQIEIAASIPAS
jgi:hypothetical protein